MLTPSHNWPAVAQTLASSALVFAVAAAMEEALFRGYPLQTLLRSWPAWLALLPSSLYFAYVHLDNPNVASGFTFLKRSSPASGSRSLPPHAQPMVPLGYTGAERARVHS